MLNKYPLWKYLFILFVVSFGFTFASPNLYAPDPAVQISGESSAMEIGAGELRLATAALEKAGIEYFGESVEKNSALIRIKERDLQLRAQAVIKRALGDNYVVALNLAQNTPDWLKSLGAGPMKLGLDLSGGVHFLMEVDTEKAVENRLKAYLGNIKSALRDADVRGFVTLEGEEIVGKFRTDALQNSASSVIREDFQDLESKREEKDGVYFLRLFFGDQQIRQIENDAVSQNLTTLRNRVNELGVAEPLIQRQGRNRIVVELPGVQDTAEAKRILGKTANLEFRLEAKYDADFSDKEEFDFRNSVSYGADSAWLERDIVITGANVANAQPSFDENGQPQVNITLDSQGGQKMHRSTRHNVKRRLGVLFVERKTRTVGHEVNAAGEEVPVLVKYDEKEIISLATIQSALGSQFRITGLDSTAEASELALLLRAGALAAPLNYVEERTVGPSLGAENIAMGVKSVVIGFTLVLIFMLFYYKVFGFVANLALMMNVVMIVALMSMLSATLTLPGIAGIVLTIGMAVDANVLIFARIREEIANGLSPQTAINAGYERAFVTILDSNLTTLLAAVILYAVGTGPVRGFAVTLSLGILTSMFTAIMGSRALINLIYGGRNVKKLAI